MLTAQRPVPGRAARRRIPERVEPEEQRTAPFPGVMTVVATDEIDLRRAARVETVVGRRREVSLTRIVGPDREVVRCSILWGRSLYPGKLQHQQVFVFP